MSARLFRSSQTEPFARGEEFGRAQGERIAALVRGYSAMWRGIDATHDATADGEAALAAIRAFAPELALEMEGIATGAGIALPLIGAINARTEILARLRAPLRGECSAVIALPGRGRQPPIAVQTWDWYDRFRDDWLTWEIRHADGSVTRTMTECGILGKAGMNSRGLGLLFTILHHRKDGEGIGLPVHVLARAILDRAQNLGHAAEIAASAPVSASTSLNLVAWDGARAAAITAEIHPGGPAFVLPEENGLLVHTNHFLAPGPAAEDTEPGTNPDTLLRRDMLRRDLAQGVARADDVLAALNSHLLGDSGPCCHPRPGEPEDQYATLATLSLDLAGGEMTVHDGGPCSCNHL